MAAGKQPTPSGNRTAGGKVNTYEGTYLGSLIARTK